MKIIEHRREDISNSLLLLGFPSRGLVGSIAANYVVEELKLRAFAGLYGEELPPTVVSHGGIAQSPVRFYTGAARCGPDGSCDKIVVGVSDLPLDPQALGLVSRTILAWAKKRKVSVVVVLEGVDAPGAAKKGGSAKQPVLGIRSMGSRHELKKFNVSPVGAGSISSHAASLLLAANELNVDLVALFTMAQESIPDARASGVLLRRVDPMLPQIPLQPGRLEKRADELEALQRAAMKEAQAQIANLRTASSMMYQ